MQLTMFNSNMMQQLRSPAASARQSRIKCTTKAMAVRFRPCIDIHKVGCSVLTANTSISLRIALQLCFPIATHLPKNK